MTDPIKPRDASRRRLSSSMQAEQRDALVRKQIEKERAASAAKTAKLRALRLAKEAADKEEEQKRASAGEAPKTSAASQRRKGFAGPDD
jgi:hypothetical protein